MPNDLPPTVSRLTRLAEAVRSLDVLICPHCGNPLQLSADQISLLCPLGHCINLNRKGYVHFLDKPHPSFYDAGLFEARTRVLSAAYTGVADILDRLLSEHGAGRILDAGCGEGWYLHQLLQRDPTRTAAGADLSQDAIRKTASWPEDVLWCICDLRRLPFRDAGFNAVLDVLTPASYSEFRRVLCSGGILLKVYPRGDYLCEIRSAMGLPEYEDDEVESYLRTHTELIRTERLRWTVPVGVSLWADFVRMTPLTASLSSEEKQRLAERPASGVTIDLQLAVCRMTPQ